MSRAVAEGWCLPSTAVLRCCMQPALPWSIATASGRSDTVQHCSRHNPEGLTTKPACLLLQLIQQMAGSPPVYQTRATAPGPGTQQQISVSGSHRSCLTELTWHPSSPAWQAPFAAGCQSAPVWSSGPGLRHLRCWIAAQRNRGPPHPSAKWPTSVSAQVQMH